MLLELAVADAYGVGHEFKSLQFVTANNDLKTYHKHGKDDIPLGAYSDDTQMSIAVALLLLSGEALTAENFAKYFVLCFKRDPRPGYAEKFYHFLRGISDHREFLAKIINHSDRAGAAMRVCPIGILPSIREVKDIAALQAAITHKTDGGIISARAAALATHYFLYQLGPKNELGRFLECELPGKWNSPWQFRVDGSGLACVRAAIAAVINSNSLSQLLHTCIAFTGDTDTVAAIAMGIGSGCNELEKDLPQVLIDGLENGPYGRDYLCDLDRQLLNMVRS